MKKKRTLKGIKDGSTFVWGVGVYNRIRQGTNGKIVCIQIATVFNGKPEMITGPKPLRRLDADIRIECIKC